MKKVISTLLLCTIAALGTQSFAFKWSMEAFPRGDQAYTLELSYPDDASMQTVRMEIEMIDTGDGFNVSSTIHAAQEDISYDDAMGAALGGSSLGMFAFGPMFMFGSAGFMIPMMLGDEDIHVSDESMRVMGMGRVSMPRSIDVDGHECVVIQLDMDDSEETIEFAIAENVPFPCYSSFGEGEERVELRLVRIQQ